MFSEFIDSFGLDTQNKIIVMCVQAFAGGISTNFRRVSLGFYHDRFALEFILEKESEEDREEIEDSTGDLDGLLLGLNPEAGLLIPFKYDVIVSSERLYNSNLDLDRKTWFSIFIRKEI